MKTFPKKLKDKIDHRVNENTLRQMSTSKNLVDFSSNDYIGFAKLDTIFNEATQILKHKNIIQNGATGSRLLTGNHSIYNALESKLCSFHKSDSALIFNSGYDANLGLFASVPQRNDVVLFDEYIHASIRDGVRLSHTKSYKYNHNDINDLVEKIQLHRGDTVYVVTESVFSMDGDSPDLRSLAEICVKNNAYLIVDEAHAIGVINNKGIGLVQQLGLEEMVFARLITFGKAIGAHGAAILSTKPLNTYLTNFARSFIYTTALPPHSIATIMAAYTKLEQNNSIKKLKENILLFSMEKKKNRLNPFFIESQSAIYCCLIPGNNKVKQVAESLTNKGYDVMPILSPTVPKGKERLRFCLHSFNSEKEISEVLQLLATFVL